MENEEYNYNIIIIGAYEDIEKQQIIDYFGNPSISELTVKNQKYSSEDGFESYERQINEQIFKGIRIIFIKNFDLNSDLKNKLFQNLIEETFRKGLIGFHLSKEEKINIFKKIIEYDMISHYILLLKMNKMKKN